MIRLHITSIHFTVFIVQRLTCVRLVCHLLFQWNLTIEWLHYILCLTEAGLCSQIVLTCMWRVYNGGWWATWCFREAGEVDTIPTFTALTTSIPGLEPTRRSFPASMKKKEIKEYCCFFHDYEFERHQCLRRFHGKEPLTSILNTGLFQRI